MWICSVWLAVGWIEFGKECQFGRTSEEELKDLQKRGGYFNIYIVIIERERKVRVSC